MTRFLETVLKRHHLKQQLAVLQFGQKLRGNKKLKRLFKKSFGIGRGHSWLRKRKRNRVVIDFFAKTLATSDDKEWKLQFGKTSPMLIVKLATALPFVIERTPKLSPVNQVALFINRLHTGHAYGHIANRFGISWSSACSIFFKIMYMINRVLRHEIHLPTQQESQHIEQTLQQREADLPSIHLVADGTHTFISYNEGREKKN